MFARPYDALADVYEWLMPDDLVTPVGSAQAFSPLLEPLDRSARILDCAAGTGQLAVGLAATGFSVVATDASEGMIARTRALAAQHHVDLPAFAYRWDQLPAAGLGHFDAVLCVGNSLAHAPGRAARQAGLAAMSSMLRDQGLVVVTSRNWEQVREHGSRIEVADRLTERNGKAGLVVYAWTIPDRWEAPHQLDVAVALLHDPPAVTTTRERLTLWPFTPQILGEDLRAAGLAQAATTYTPSANRYVVTAEKIEPIRGPATASSR
ncbi:MAG: class I SAM-dependent methyltransferase [Solirubrobacterales bacterium]|nr:class I SAM-dependent methyltransferase [Solirubrobacterales bacterium]